MNSFYREGEQLDKLSSLPGTINVTVLDALRVMSEEVDPTLMGDLIQIFKEEMPKRIALIKASVEKCDMVCIRNAAHVMRSTLGTMGAERLLAISTTLETAAAQSDLLLVRELVGLLDHEYEKICNRLDSQ